MEIVELIPLILLSFAAFTWLRHPVVFMAAGAIAMFDGFYWFDTYSTDQALTVSIGLFLYGLILWGLAFGNIFAGETEQ